MNHGHVSHFLQLPLDLGIGNPESTEDITDGVRQGRTAGLYDDDIKRIRALYG